MLYVTIYLLFLPVVFSFRCMRALGVDGLPLVRDQTHKQGYCQIGFSAVLTTVSCSYVSSPLLMNVTYTNDRFLGHVAITVEVLFTSLTYPLFVTVTYSCHGPQTAVSP